MDKLVVDVYGISIDGTVIIIEHNSNIHYTAQCGGVGCDHPEFEGVAFDIGDMFMHFDDCSYGCSYIGYDIKLQTKLAKDLNKLLIDASEDMTYDIIFDYTRISELQEGWWPVIITGTIFDTKIGTRKAIIHTSNCD